MMTGNQKFFKICYGFRQKWKEIYMSELDAAGLIDKIGR